MAMFRRARQTSERLERALDGGPIPHDPETRSLLAAAGALAPAQTRDPARIQQTHDLMMAAFLRTLNPDATREDAGTDDGLEPMELHRAEVDLPDGGQIVVSDIEELTPERLAATAAAIDEITARRAKDTRVE
ncbi:hypothetical protein ACFCWY_08480 [Streptomyces sp. NPDC056362]|uniref:hypothetical protein n=1 Tax=unclassified Streptomyces TaxID=2593676 RepID=UPI0035D88857